MLVAVQMQPLLIAFVAMIGGCFLSRDLTERTDLAKSQPQTVA